MSILKKEKVFLIIQIPVIICCLLGLFRQRASFSISEASFLAKENSYQSEAFSLTPGVYRFHLYYQTEQDMASVWLPESEQVGFGGMYANACMLYSGLEEAEMLVYLTAPVDDLRITVNQGEDCTVTVLGAEIEGTRIGNVLVLLTLLTLFAGVDALWWWTKNKGWAPEKKQVLFVCALIVIAASFPLFTGYLIKASDMGYHLMRIEGVKDGLLTGQFPVRMQPNWLQGHGYATGIFYCDAFLYPFAILRILGVPVGMVYILYRLGVNIATVGVGYFSFYRIFKKREIALFGTALYTLSIYRLVCMYIKDLIGQYTAMIFLPLLAYALYNLLSERVDGEEYKRAWIPLFLSVTGIVLCHVLTLELAGITCAVICLFYWKRTFRKETMLEMGKAFLATLFFNAWFLIPFLDYMALHNLRITGEAVFLRTIQGHGSLPAQLFVPVAFAGHGDGDISAGMQGEVPFTVGAALLLALVFYGYVWLIKKKKMSGITVCIGGIVTLLLATSLFPWDKLHSMGGILAKLISALQYPTRFLMLSALFLAMTGCYAWKEAEEVKKETLRIYVGISLVLLVIVTGLFNSRLLSTSAFYRIYDERAMGTGYLSGREYLPENVDESALRYNAYRASEGIEYHEKIKRGTTVKVEFYNTLQTEGWIEVPLLKYEGYRATEGLTGQELSLTEGENGCIRVCIPANMSGILDVEFKSPWYWRAAELFSSLAFLGLFVFGLKWNRTKKLLFFVYVLGAGVFLYCMVGLCKEGINLNFVPVTMQINGGEIKEDGSYLVTEENGIPGEICLSTGALSLSPGVYRVELKYETDAEQMSKVEAPSLGYRGLFQNAVSIREQRKQKGGTYRFVLLEKADDLEASITYTGEGKLKVHGIRVVETGEKYTMLLFLLILFSCAGIFLYSICKKKKYKMDIETKQVFLMLSFIFLIACLPLFLDYIVLGDDLFFHLTRIEGVAREWVLGKFPVRMQSLWLNGSGYPVSVMYADFFLWFPALLRCIGFDLAVCYKSFVFLINFMTVWVSYYSFRDIFREKKLAVIGTGIYILSLYRLYNIYQRAAVGEYTAMVFLPLIAAGFVRIFAKEEEKVREWRTTAFLTIGFSGILLSHVLSLELLTGVTIILCLLCWKRTFRKNTFWSWIRTVFVTMLLSAWFLIPFLDYTLNTNMKVFHTGKPIQALGLYVMQLFWVFPWMGMFPYMYQTGMQDVRPYGMGLSLVIIGVLFTYLLLNDREKKEQEQTYSIACFSYGLGVLSCLLCLSLFPWDALASLSGVLERLIYSIQFPYRFLTIVTICFSLLGICVIKIVAEKKKKSGHIFTGIIIGATILTALFFMEDMLQIRGWSDVREIEALGTEGVSGGEYLPMDIDLDSLVYTELMGDEDVVITDWEKNGTLLTIDCENRGTSESGITTNLIYYPGYEANERSSGKKLQIVQADNKMLKVYVPPDFHGEVNIEFKGMWYWKAADVISVISIVGFTVYLWKQRCRDRKERSI